MRSSSTVPTAAAFRSWPLAVITAFAMSPPTPPGRNVLKNEPA